MQQSVSCRSSRFGVVRPAARCSGPVPTALRGAAPVAHALPESALAAASAPLAASSAAPVLAGSLAAALLLVVLLRRDAPDTALARWEREVGLDLSGSEPQAKQLRRRVVQDWPAALPADAAAESPAPLLARVAAFRAADAAERRASVSERERAASQTSVPNSAGAAARARADALAGELAAWAAFDARSARKRALNAAQSPGSFDPNAKQRAVRAASEADAELESVKLRAKLKAAVETELQNAERAEGAAAMAPSPALRPSALELDAAARWAVAAAEARGGAGTSAAQRYRASVAAKRQGGPM